MKRALAIFLMVALLSPPLFAPTGVIANEQIVPNGVQRIGAASDSATVLDYSDIGVAVVDTGVDLHNPDLNVVGGVDCTDPAQPFTLSQDSLVFSVEAFATEEWNELRNPTVTGYDDGHGHGTHVAGIIGAKDDGRGVVGVAPGASIWSVRVLNSGGSGSLDNIVCGLEWVHENRDLIDVVNMSLGVDVGEPVLEVFESCDEQYDPPAPVYLPQPEKKQPDPFQGAICQLYEDGIPVVVAAGNGPGDSRTTLPAALEEVITVSNFVDTDGLPGGLGGIQDTDICPFGGMDDTFFAHHNHTPDQRMESYSGRAVDIMAPGVCVLSTVPGGYMAMTGTSMASPHVAGVVARIIADGAPHDVEIIRGILLDNAEKSTGQFHDIDDSWEPLVRLPAA